MSLSTSWFSFFFSLIVCVVLQRTLLFAFVRSFFPSSLILRQPPSGVTVLVRACVCVCGSVWRVVVSNALYFPIRHTNWDDNNMACSSCRSCVSSILMIIWYDAEHNEDVFCPIIVQSHVLSAVYAVCGSVCGAGLTWLARPASEFVHILNAVSMS